MSLALTLTDEDKLILRTAAYGAVTLLSAAGAAGAAGGSPHTIAAEGAIALACATGLVGHVLADRTGGVYLTGKSTAELADQVLPALTAAMELLRRQSPAEAGNFRSTVLVAVDAATRTRWGASSPAVAEMTRYIVDALDAADAPPSRWS
ncbi:MAG: hypothetical protein HOV79_16920 [Hamadaea sp.]|nr:hypothetical protein [Hamadaea sp.]